MFHTKSILLLVRNFKLYPYFNKDNSWIIINEGATLSFVYDPKLYLPLRPSRFEGYELMNFSAPLYFDRIASGGIIGGGKIEIKDPKKWHLWDKKEDPSKKLLLKYAKNNTPLAKRIFGQQNANLRPPFVQLYKTKNFTLSDIRVKHSTMWTVHMLYSDNLLLQNLNIFTDGPNTDGIVIDSSTNVVVQNSDLNTGDDAIVLKSGSDDDGRRIAKPTSNVLIENITVNKAHGAVVIGSEMSGGVKNVTAKNIKVTKADIGLRIKTRPSRGGYVNNIRLNNLQAQTISDDLIRINNHYSEAIGKSKATPELCPKIANINISNVSSQTANRAIVIDGLKECPIKNLSLKNIATAQQQRSKIINAIDPQLSDINITFQETSPNKQKEIIWNKDTDRAIKKFVPSAHKLQKKLSTK